MTSGGTRRRWGDRLFLLASTIAFGVFVGLILRHPLVARDDVWNHLAVGHWIWQEGRLPEGTLHVWTANQSHVYHSWLTQVSLHGLFCATTAESFPGVASTFAALVILVGLGLMWFVGWRCGGFSTGLALASLIAIEASAGRFQIRPDLFTSLFLAALAVFLVLWSGRPRDPDAPQKSRLRFAALVAMVLTCFTIWANFHGAVVLGLVLIGVTAVGDLIQDRCDLRSRRLALLAIAAPVGICINPYGLRYWESVLAVRSETFTYILEWAPVWNAKLPARAALLARAGVLLALAMAAWWLNPRRRWAHLAWLLAFLVLFLQARRNIWPFCQVAVAVVAANAAYADWSKLPTRWAAWVRFHSVEPARWLLRAAILLWISIQCVTLELEYHDWRPMGPAILESGPVRFVMENRLSGRLFNDAEAGSYLQWRFDGSPELYLDIINAYPPGVVRDQIDIAKCTPRGQVLLDEQGIEIVLLTADRAPHTGTLANLANHLDSHSEWCRVHVSRGGMVWVRRNSKYEPIWRPREGRVHPVVFSVLEEHARDREKETPPLVDDMDRERGRQPPPTWRLFER